MRLGTNKPLSSRIVFPFVAPVLLSRRMEPIPTASTDESSPKRTFKLRDGLRRRYDSGMNHSRHGVIWPDAPESMRIAMHSKGWMDYAEAARWFEECD